MSLPASVPQPQEMEPWPQPQEVVARAAKMAEALMDVVRHGRNLAVDIKGRQYLRLEAWLTLAAFAQASVSVESVSPLPEGRGYEAWAVVTARDGRQLSRAQASCSRDEEAWADRPDYAVRSMAETRAAAKALRLAFAYVPVLAGYEPTPAEEVEGLQASQAPQSRAPQRPQAEQSQDGRRTAPEGQEAHGGRRVVQAQDHKRRFAGHLRAAGWPLDRAREVWQPLYPGIDKWDQLEPYRQQLLAEAAPHLVRLVRDHGQEGARQLIEEFVPVPDLVTVDELRKLADGARILDPLSPEVKPDAP